MPAATTHYLFAKDAYKLLAENIKEKITNINMYYLGSQGPDIFFYHKGGKFKGTLTKFGSFLHNNKVYETITYFFNFAKDDPDLLSYAYGFLAHYALDSNAHPLVIYASRYLNNPDESESDNHCRIEAFFDTYVMKKKGMSIKDYRTYKEVRINDVSISKLADMYQNMAKDIFDKDIELETLKEVPKDTVLYLKLLRPSTKIKFEAYKLLEKVVFKNRHFITSLMLYNDNIPKAKEIINLEHKEYFNVFDEKEKRTSSFDDCYEKGINDYLALASDYTNKELYKYTFEGKPNE